MKLTEIERIRTALKDNRATHADCLSATDEAIRYHHKATELQQHLLLIKKMCQKELQELEAGKTLSPTHFSLVLESLIDSVEESQHVKAA